jgi:hypothetical protein
MNKSYLPYKRITPPKIIKFARENYPQVKSWAVDSEMHDDGRTRMWMSEFNSPTAAITYATSNSVSPIDFIEFETQQAKDGSVLGYMRFVDKWSVPSSASGIPEKEIKQHFDDIRARVRSEREEYTRQEELQRQRDAEEDSRTKEKEEAATEQYRRMSDEEIDAMIDKNPSSLLKLPHDMRTIQRYVTAASLYPFILTCIKDPATKSEVKKELEQSGEGELQRIKQLSGK